MWLTLIGDASPKYLLLRKHADQTLEVHDGIVSRLIEQKERVRGVEKCPNCGHYNLELKILLDEIVKLMIEKGLGVKRRPHEIYQDQIESLFEEE